MPFVPACLRLASSGPRTPRTDRAATLRLSDCAGAMARVKASLLCRRFAALTRAMRSRSWQLSERYQRARRTPNMVVVRCTQKLLVQAETIRGSAGDRVHHAARRLVRQHPSHWARQHLLFISERSRLPVIVPIRCTKHVIFAAFAVECCEALQRYDGEPVIPYWCGRSCTTASRTRNAARSSAKRGHSVEPPRCFANSAASATASNSPRRRQGTHCDRP